MHNTKFVCAKSESRFTQRRWLVQKVTSCAVSVSPDVTHSPGHITVTNTLYLLSSEHAVCVTILDHKICISETFVAYLCGTYRAALAFVTASVTYGKLLLCRSGSSVCNLMAVSMKNAECDAVNLVNRYQILVAICGIF